MAFIIKFVSHLNLKGGLPLLEIAKIHTISNMIMMLLPHRDLFFQTQIHTTDEIFYSPKTPFEIIKEIIISHNYSTYEGRRKAIVAKWKLYQNTPIPIDHRRFICAIPTHSPHTWDCTWLFYKNIAYIEKDDNNRAIVYFCNGDNITLSISAYQMKLQWRKAGNLLAQMMLEDFHNDF